METQLDLFGNSLPWEDASAPSQEAAEAETPAEKRLRRQEENRLVVLAHLRRTGHSLSAFEVAEALRVMGVDIKAEQVRAAFVGLRSDSLIVATGESDSCSPAGADPARYTLPEA